MADLKQISCRMFFLKGEIYYLIFRNVENSFLKTEVWENTSHLPSWRVNAHTHTHARARAQTQTRTHETHYALFFAQILDMPFEMQAHYSRTLTVFYWAGNPKANCETQQKTWHYSWAIISVAEFRFATLDNLVQELEDTNCACGSVSSRKMKTLPRKMELLFWVEYLGLRQTYLILLDLRVTSVDKLPPT
jgi:hypothetical protein